MLASSSTTLFQRKLDRLAREFEELNTDDAGLDSDNRFGMHVVLALRPWTFGLFEKIRKS